MTTLCYHRGDAQSLKPIIASYLHETTPAVKLEPHPSKGEVKNESLPISSLRFKSGVQITDFTAMAEALSTLSITDPFLYAKIHEWMEWETCVLKPIIHSKRRASELHGALAKIENALKTKKQKYLVGEKPTVVDVVLFATLFPLRHQDSLPQSVKNYLASLFSLKPFSQGLEKILDGLPEDSCLEFLEKDVQRQAQNAPKLPVNGERNILVTSALPYVNNVPHLGNIIGCVLSADCYARFCRARGFNTIYICGTDEYGTATETKAYEEGVSCEEICDKYHAIHKEIYEWFGISCDKFGRTPTRHQTKIAQDIFLALKEKDNIVENEMEQLFSTALGKFLADRFIVGTCPKCGYEDARGDQCDQCGSLLNPTELTDPKCKLTGTTPILKKTKHVFLDLPRLSPELQKYIDETSQHGGWSSNCLQITNAWMRDGLKQRCITRDLKWGIPVPLEGYEDKVFYVWFDAPIGYISITADYTSEWERWWKSPQDVELVQFMGKDNVPFHTVIFPSTLLGTGESWTMMKKISVTEYLNYESGKFSKSRGTGVFGDNAKESGIPAEVWRYYLLSNRPEQQDSTFAWDNLGVQNNSELLNNLGNFINRGLKFVEKFYDGVVPQMTSQGHEESLEFGKELWAKVESFLEKMENIQMRAALAVVMDISATGNKFLQDYKPWELMKESPEKCKTVVRAGAGLVKLLAALLQPFIPSITDKILQQLNLSYEEGSSLKTEDLEKVKDPCSLLPEGHKINEATPLFSKITDEQLDKFRELYKGKQQEKSESNTKKKKQKTAGKDKSKDSKKEDESKESKKEDMSKDSKKEDKSKDDVVDVSRLDLRVGYIEKAWKHPDADTLYVEEINIGEETARTVVSGLVKFIAEEEMQKRWVVLLCNTKPANMRGIKSHAMVLAAASSDGKSVELVEPPEGSTLGERVVVAGFEGEPDEVLKPKQKVFENVQPDLKTNESCIACYKDQPFKTSKGECKVRSIAQGSIR